jgi:hypothetical protein
MINNIYIRGTLIRIMFKWGALNILIIFALP